MNTRTVPLANIDLSDDTYDIGRRVADDRLSVSMSRFGMLRTPVLLESPSRLSVLDGFNRIRTAACLGWREAGCQVVTRVDTDEFLSRALEREYQRRIGPVGKVRLAGILEKLFADDPGRCADICLRGFAVPEQVFSNIGLRSFILGMPQALREYCDARDINYRVMVKLMSLPETAIARLSGWTSQGRMKVNLFRSIVDMMDDIFRRDGNTGFIEGIDDVCCDEAGLDSYVHERIFEVRYPEYAKIKKRAERIVGRIVSPGVSIDIPHNLEGPAARIRIELDTREGVDGALKKIRRFDERTIAALLSALS